MSDKGALQHGIDHLGLPHRRRIAERGQQLGTLFSDVTGTL